MAGVCPKCHTTNPESQTFCETCGTKLDRATDGTGSRGSGAGPSFTRDERTVERFRNEIKLACKITHKNVCRMHELHEEGRTLFITMEYVAGQDLKGLIRECGALSLGKAVSIAKQVCEGLAHSLLASLRLQRPQPGPGQDEAGGRAGGEVHAPAGARPGAADVSGTRGQGRLSLGP